MAGRLAPMTTSPLGPALPAVLGALGIAFSGIFVKLAAVSPETAAFFRCTYAVPVLFGLAARERLGVIRDASGAGAVGRTAGRAAVGALAAARRSAWLGGVFFAADLVFWHHAINALGAGLATVMGNLQVVGVSLATWAIFGERPSARVLAALPLALTGVVLISGVLDHRAYGDDPLRGVLFGLGTAAAYSGYLILLRQAGRRGLGAAQSLVRATAGAGVAIAAYGLPTGTLDLVPHWPAHGWLLALALGPQVVGWLLITVSLPKLPAAVGSVLLLVQPAGSVVLGRVLLAEQPSALQLGGVALILAGVVLASLRRSPHPSEPVTHAAKPLP